MGLNFDVMSPDVDESLLPDEAPHAYVERLSSAKAAAGLAQGSNQVVIAADTIVTLDGLILGNPLRPMTARLCCWPCRDVRIGYSRA